MTLYQLAEEYYRQYLLLLRSVDELRQKRKQCDFTSGEALGRRIQVAQQMAEECFCTYCRLKQYSPQ